MAELEVAEVVMATPWAIEREMEVAPRGGLLYGAATGSARGGTRACTGNVDPLGGGS